MEQSEIIEEIRFITDYPEMVVSDGKVQSAIRFTKNEMRAIFGDEEMVFESYPAQRAIMWGSCYHLKIQTGEIGGFPISIGDIDLRSINRSRGEENTDIIKWAEKFQENIYRMDNAPLGFGSTNEIRTDYEYGGNSAGGSSGGSGGIE